MLPPRPVPFEGRRTELGSLRAEIDRPGLRVRGGAPSRSTRVLLIAGRPGSGRTSLAVHLAHDLADRYPDGRLFVRLTHPPGERVPTEQIARDLLRALGAPPPPHAAARDLAAELRQALGERRVLLVLDDAADSEQILPLLPDTPGCLVVVTAGGPLTAVADARPCVLGGLDSTAATALLTQAAGSTRITCDPLAAEALTEECGSHPTALRLMAGWLAARPRASVADGLARLRDLGGDGARIPSAPLARAFRLVHDELPPAVARLLRLLVLSPAGLVDAHAASALAGCSVAAAESALHDLAQRGLLPREPVEGEYRVPGCLYVLLDEHLRARERPAEIQLARARMLERTVRRLGACRTALSGGDLAAPPGGPTRRGSGTGAWTRGRGAGSRQPREGLQDRAGRAGGAGEPERGQPARQSRDIPRELRFASPQEAEDWLHRRLSWHLAAARAAVSGGDLDNLARRLIAALVRTLSLPGGEATGGGSTAELYQLHALVLDVARRRELHREQAAALINLGDMDAAAGRAVEALDRYRAALAAARADGDEAAAGRAMESIGNTHRELGDQVRAVDWYLRALAVRESRGELTDQARLHGCLGVSYVRMRRWAEATRAWRSAATLHRRAQDMPAHARALTEVARVLEYAGHPEDALRTCREALRWARHLDDVRLEAAVLLRMSDTLERLGDPTGARVQREEAERLLTS